MSHAVVRVDHVEARGAVARLHRGAHAEARTVDAARHLEIPVVDRRVQERDVAQSMSPSIAWTQLLSWTRFEMKTWASRQQRPLELGQRRRRLAGPMYAQTTPPCSSHG